MLISGLDKPGKVLGRDQRLALKNGELEAFKLLFRVLYPRMKGYCRLFVREQQQAEDIIQECFLTLWEKRENIDPDKTVESYLFVILRNRCLNYLREVRLKSGSMDPAKLDINELQFLYQLDFTDREEKSAEQQLVMAFHQAVDLLPARVRQVFQLCKMEGRPQKEVAGELGISLKTVEKHIATAKQQIAEQLTRKYPLWAVVVALWLR